MDKRFLVYSVSGFSSAHATARAAINAAKRAARLHGVLYTVVRRAAGYTGAGGGEEIWASNGAPARG